MGPWLTKLPSWSIEKRLETRDWDPILSYTSIETDQLLESPSAGYLREYRFQSLPDWLHFPDNGWSPAMCGTWHLAKDNIIVPHPFKAVFTTKYCWGPAWSCLHVSFFTISIQIGKQLMLIVDTDWERVEEDKTRQRFDPAEHFLPNAVPKWR